MRFHCAGLRVTFDQRIALRQGYVGGLHGMWRGGGFEIWNDQLGAASKGGTSRGSTQLVSPLCIECAPRARVCNRSPSAACSPTAARYS